MLRKVRGLTWIKKWQNCCCGAQWEVKRIIITNEGVI